jgi:hypothetical protein
MSGRFYEPSSYTLSPLQKSLLINVLPHPFLFHSLYTFFFALLERRKNFFQLSRAQTRRPNKVLRPSKKKNIAHIAPCAQKQLLHRTICDVSSFNRDVICDIFFKRVCVCVCVCVDVFDLVVCFFIFKVWQPTKRKRHGVELQG